LVQRVRPLRTSIDLTSRFYHRFGGKYLIVEYQSKMPRPGDQYGQINNPFVEPPTRISEYTAQQIITIQKHLDRYLGPEYISTRPGPGGKKLHYIAAEKAIGLANEIFGFNGWSSSIQNVQIDFVSFMHPNICAYIDFDLG
jgi:hypothetical protein